VSPVTSSIYTVRVASISITNTGDLNLDLNAGTNVADISGNLLSNVDPPIHEYYILTTGTLATKIIQLRGSHANNKVRLEWSFDPLANGEFFQVKTSTDGVNWKLLTEITKGTAAKYTYTDLRPSTGDNYYQVSIKLNDNLFVQSNILLLRNSLTETSFQILNNPVKDGQLQVLVYQPGFYFLLASDGRKCFSNWFEVGQHQLNIANLRAGTYYFGGHKRVRSLLIF
jgi:hypothetical protein